MRRVWTREELATIELRWGVESLDSLCRRLGRGREAVYRRAYELGLLRRDSGIKTAEQLAQAFGVHRSTVARAMEWAGLRPLAPWRRAARNEVWTSTRYDFDAAREAFERWLAAETMAAAAERHGKCEGWVRRRLMAAGVYVARTGHRYPAEVVDRAVREYGRGAAGGAM